MTVPDLFVDGYARLTGTVLDRDPNEPEDYAVAKLTIATSVPVLLSAAEARKLASKLIDYADEIDRQNGTTS